MPNNRSPFRIGMRAALGVLVIVIGAALAWELRHLVMLGFLALLVVAALLGPSTWLEQRGWPRLAAILVFYAGLVGVLGFTLFLIVPPLVEEAVQLWDNLPEILEDAQLLITDVIGGIIGADAVSRAFDIIGGAGAPGVDTLLGGPMLVAEVLINLVIVLVLSIFMLLERDRIRDWALRFFEEGQRQRVRTLSANAIGKLGAYVRGQFILMVMVGVGATIGMLILGVPFALPLGMLAFFAEAIPMAGPWIAGIPIVLVAFFESPLTALLIGIWFTVLQQLESYVLGPVVHGHVVKLSPLVVMFGILAGATVAGVVGAIIAVPLVAVIDLFIDEIILPLRRGENALEPKPESAEA
jgi:putative heme transporter